MSAAVTRTLGSTSRRIDNRADALSHSASLARHPPGGGLGAADPRRGGLHPPDVESTDQEVEDHGTWSGSIWSACWRRWDSPRSAALVRAGRSWPTNRTGRPPAARAARPGRLRPGVRIASSSPARGGYRSRRLLRRPEVDGRASFARRLPHPAIAAEPWPVAATIAVPPQDSGGLQRGAGGPCPGGREPGPCGRDGSHASWRWTLAEVAVQREGRGRHRRRSTGPETRRPRFRVVRPIPLTTFQPDRGYGLAGAAMRAGLHRPSIG